MRDYVGIAQQYADDVVSGEIVACEFVKQACQRQLNDLNRDDFGYHFSHDHASRICHFIELLPHIKGKWANKRLKIRLEPWQIFILTTVFGWVDDECLRRFKVVYIEVPRKNAKSTISSGVGLYLLSAEGEEGAEIYSAATTREQAKIVWDDAKSMVDRCSGLRLKFGVDSSARSIYVRKSSSSFKALSRDQGGNHDGLNIYGAIIDELHVHKSRDLYDVLDTGTGSRDQPLLWVITTAGSNRAGVCYEKRSYALKVLNKAVVDDEYFGIVYTIDKDDDWRTSSSWIKANPNWGVSVNPGDIQRKAREAQSMSGEQNNFLTKHLCVWVNADIAWMGMNEWEKCADPKIMIDQYRGQKCWLGLDLATKKDIASMAIVFEKDRIFTGFVRNYLPMGAIESGRNSQYKGWEKDGHLIATRGSATDYGLIEDDIRELASQFEIQEVAYDTWQSNYLASRLIDDGIPMVEFRQATSMMSEPMKELEALVLDGKFKHDGCPVLAWMVSNVVCHTDKKDNIYPNKEQSENKIDGVVALIMAIGRASLNDIATSVYETRDVRRL